MSRKFKYLIAGILVCCFSYPVANAQQVIDININSPYSLQGLGELRDENFAIQKGWGDFSFGFRSPLSFTTRNPASYSALHYTNLSGLVYARYSNFTHGERTGFTKHANLGPIAFGVAIDTARKWGASFGLLPFAETGYRLNYTIVDDTLPRTEEFLGHGSINRVYLGSGIAILPNLHVGANASFIFGNNFHSHIIYFNPGQHMYNAENLTTDRINDFTFDLGLQYVIPVNRNNLTIGLISNLPANLNSNREQIIETYRGGGIFIDTAVYIPSQNYNTYLPLGAGVGLTYQVGTRWLWGADFYYRQWSRFETDFSSGNLNDLITAGAGFNYIPESEHVTSYFRRTSYRFGIKYAQPYLSMNGEPLHDLTIQTGIGLPMRRRTSSINFAIEAGTRTNDQPNIISEQYLRLHLGINFNDRWFDRRQID